MNRQQTAILNQVGLAAPSKPDLSSDEALLTALDSRNLAARKAEKDAVAGRIAEALKLAANFSNRKCSSSRLRKRRCTPRTRSGNGWSARRRRCSHALANGPVQVS